MASNLPNTSPLKKAILDGNVDLSIDLMTQGVVINLAASVFEGKFNMSPMLRGDRERLKLIIRKNIKEVARLLIKKDSDVNVPNKHGQTHLFLASINTKEEVARLLIEKGADVNVSDSKRQTPLFFAAKNTNEEVARLLIEEDADVNISDKNGKTPLFIAAENTNEGVARLLIEKGANVNVSDSYGQTPLFIAAKNTKEEVARLLIEKGANVNFSDIYGQTPLFIAAKNTKEEVARLLIEKGANVNFSDIYGQTPLFIAAKNTKEEVARLLIEKGADVNVSDRFDKTSPLFIAAKNTNEEAARLLIEKGANVNVSDRDGQTPLFVAAKNRNEEVARLLIEKGADVNVSDRHGRTPLFIAAKNTNEGAARLLIEKGANVNVSDSYGQTPLFIAAENRNEEVARLLIEKGADGNVSDSYGQTPLFIAAENRNEEVARLLIEKGADGNVSDRDGQTPLFFAAKNKNEGVARLLIKKEVDVTASDNSGKTSLFFAATNENKHIARLLIEEGTDVNARDIYGRTALFYAVLTCHTVQEFKVIASMLIHKGANLNDTDNYDVSVLSYFIERCCCDDEVSAKYHRYGDFDLNDIYGDGYEFSSAQLKFFTKNGIKNSTVVRSTLTFLYVNLPNHLQSANGVIQEEGKEIFAQALSVASKYAADRDLTCIENLKALLDKDEIPEALDALKMLGVNSNSSDSHGNTALHYATLLPFHGVSQECVMKILQTLEKHRLRFNVRNQENETPLHFCLSEQAWEPAIVNDTWSKIVSIAEICKFLLKDRSLIFETTRRGETVYHLIMKLIQKGLSMNDKEVREVVCFSALKQLELFSKATGNNLMVLNRMDNKCNSPLHLWATLHLPSRGNYGDSITKDLTFEMFLNTTLKHLIKPGVNPNPRNEEDQTPLHLCNTWAAFDLLLNAGAYTSSLDIHIRPPLLNVAKRHVFEKKEGHFFPDLKEGQKEFYERCMSGGLDIWKSDKHGESILTILLKKEMFELSEALIEVACDQELSPSLVKQMVQTICTDASTRTHWKSHLIRKILTSKECRPSDINDALLHCCTGIKKLHDQGKIVVFEGADTSVNVEIARQLRLHGADSKKCIHLCNDFPELESFLVEEIDLDDVPMSIPWTSYSKAHAPKLARVARKQNVQEIGTYLFHEKPIGSGSFGHVFAGISKKDGREIAVKKIEKLRMDRPEDRREIKNLTALADCSKIVRYIFFDDNDKDFAYIVLELMEGDLDDYFTSSSFDHSRSGLICKDVVEALAYLHQCKPKQIVHRDLKPGNILYKLHPILCLKIADFGLSSPMGTGETTVFRTNVGTRCWIAPEVIRSVSSQHSMKSDIFSSGLLLHYILSNQKHPFSPPGCTRTFSEISVHQTLNNLLYNKMEGWNDSLSPEAAHLVESMLQQDESDRPSAADSLSHPLFWSNEKKMEFLRAVGNQDAIACRRPACGPLNAFESDLESAQPRIINHGDWNNVRYTHTSDIYTNMQSDPHARRNCDTRSVVELVRFIRNALGHVSEAGRPTLMQKQILDGVFMEEFPNLLMEVYKAVNKHGWNLREEIKKVLDDN
ncbi:uncharacterized protein LOC110251065 isoform X2 [Exaiptasia diaphana]|uniref:Uncharacterized protein n=1 Tax=Exaiptasia diaphana TaxID=2652724 RepID=A0A913YWY3_EXADI|nr:uncharacterized protein LOC110251065 isoform X2 [Exaiptasia diaphana]